MKRSLLKCSLAPVFGLALTLALLGLMSYFSSGARPARAADRTVCLAGPPSCTFTNVQAAVDAALPGDVIKVAAGTYTGVSARAGITQMVYLSQSVTIRGGYTSTNTFADPPDPAANPTTLDAQGQGRVLFITGEISPTIEGLRITGGYAPADLFTGRGGGVHIVSATAVLQQNWVFSNTADGDGGGLALINSSATVSNNQITSNQATGFSSLNLGGGLYVVGSALIEANVISANIAEGGGGGVLLAGGGGPAQAAGAARFSRNRVVGNNACYAGGVDLVLSTAILSGNIISGNRAVLSASCTEGLGGGFIIDQQSDATLINNLVAGNQADGAGSGFYIRGSSPRLLHNTIARNSGGDGSGFSIIGFFGLVSSTVSLTNNILVSHTVGITIAAGNTATLESTLWAGNATDEGGVGIISRTNDYNGNPAFANPAGGDYHLQAGSAALNVALSGVGVNVDFEGDPRPLGLGPDLGFDESAASADQSPGLYLPLILKNP